MILSGFCLLRIFLYLKSKFISRRWVRVIWFFRIGTWMWSLGGRSISHLGGSPTATDQSKSRGAHWNHRWLETSICDNLKRGVFCWLSQTYLYFLCLTITNDFNLWAWPYGLDVDRTTLKISCVFIFIAFISLPNLHVFEVYSCKRSLLQQTLLLWQTETG